MTKKSTWRKLVSAMLALALLSVPVLSALGENADSLSKYDPAIDIVFVRAVDNDLTSNVLPQTPNETIESNRWFDLYQEELGINISYAWTVQGGYTDDAYKQKINVTLASGDLPDVITVTSAQLKQLADADVIEDLTGYFDQYASDLTRQVYSDEGSSVLDSATFEGKLMAIPNLEASIESAQFLWIRKDWLDKLGLDVPTTMQELLAVSTAFATQDPDGNGIADTYGLAITKDLYAGCMGVEGFFAGFHAYPNFWTTDADGKLVYGSVQPEMKDALTALAAMYQNGEIDQEFGVKDGGKVAETIAAGKIGIDFGEQWNPLYPLNQNYNNDPTADWISLPIPSVDDTAVSVPLKFRTNMYFAVRKGFEHPEALVKLVNMHLEKNWGETNNFSWYYMPAENGNTSVWKFSPVTPYPPYKNLNAFLEIEAARNADAMDTLVGEAKVIQSNVDAYLAGDGSVWGWDKIYGVEGVYNVLKAYRDNGQLLVEKFTGAPTETMVERRATLEQMEKEMIVKVIMGAASIDEFDKFVSDWYQLGGQAITDEVNAWYASLSAAE